MPYTPTIGITTYGVNDQNRFHLPREYVDCVRKAGGLPFLIAPGESQLSLILERLDGIILAGGGDIDPTRYAGNVHHESIDRVDMERDDLEFRLAEMLLNESLPVFGICRGQQVLNVVTGGRLIEHLPDKYGDEITHRCTDGGGINHSVSVRMNTMLHNIVNVEELDGVSMHHQCVANVSDDWIISSQSPDGIVESQEHKRHPWMLAVQWHPELSPDNEQQMALFRAHVEAARRYAAVR